MTLRHALVLILLGVAVVSGNFAFLTKLSQSLNIEPVINAGRDVLVTGIDKISNVAVSGFSYFSKESDNALAHAKLPVTERMKMDSNEVKRRKIDGDVTMKWLGTERDSKQIVAYVAMYLCKTFVTGAVGIVGIRAVEYYIDFKHIDSNNEAELRKQEIRLENAKLSHSAEMKLIESDLENMKLDALLAAIDSDERLKELVVKVMFLIAALTITSISAVAIFWTCRPKDDKGREAHEKEKRRLLEEIDRKKREIANKDEIVRKVEAELDLLDEHNQRMQPARAFMSSAFHGASRILENAEFGTGVRARTGLHPVGGQIIGETDAQ